MPKVGIVLDFIIVRVPAPVEVVTNKVSQPQTAAEFRAREHKMLLLAQQARRVPIHASV